MMTDFIYSIIAMFIHAELRSESIPHEFGVSTESYLLLEAAEMKMLIRQCQSNFFLPPPTLKEEGLSRVVCICMKDIQRKRSCNMNIPPQALKNSGMYCYCRSDDDRVRLECI